MRELGVQPVDDDIQMVQVQTAKEVLESIVVKWHIHNLIYEVSSGVQSIQLN